MMSRKLRLSSYGSYNPSFGNVSMLLHGDGTNAENNNTFIDSSANNFTFTKIGAPMQGSVNPFANNIPYSPINGASGFFNGSSALTVSDNVAFTMGAGDFTIDGWIYATSVSGTTYALGQINSTFTNSTASFFIQISAGSLVGYVASGSTFYGAFGTISINVWTHVAFVRQGTTLRLYVNGIQVGTNATISTLAINDSTQVLAIGRNGARTTEYFNGYLSDIRIIKGTALYLNGTTFAVPTTPSTAVSGTSLLCNFKNAGIYDSSAKTELITQGNAQLSTAVLKYGTASMAFDGTGDYLSSPFNVSFDLLPNSFTVEGWFYTTNLKAGGQRIFSTGGGLVGWNSTTGIHVLCQINDAVGSIGLQLSTNTATPVVVNSAAGSIIVNAWTHLAFVYDAAITTGRIFANGVLVATQSLSGVARPTTSPQINIATIPGETGVVTSNFQGYMDDFQLTKGVAKYNMSFSPPLKQYPNS